MFACQVFWMPKAGNTPAEYEDAFWPRSDRRDESGPLCLAVADGATETSFSGLWARLLVSSCGRGRLTAETLTNELTRIRKVWRRAVGQKPLPWYAEEKLRLGAFSSILGLTFQRGENAGESSGPWRAMAMGDSCLLQSRGGDLVCSFPYAHADEFNSRPRLLSSMDNDDPTDQGVVTLSGSWCSGDVFYLMTDALACWCLSGLEKRENVFDLLDSIRSQTGFAYFVSRLRSITDDEGSLVLKNDDVTLVRCTIS